MPLLAHQIAVVGGLLLLTACSKPETTTQKVPGSAMHPTVPPDGHIHYAKGDSIERGQVVVLEDPCDSSRKLVRRVVAVGGEAVEVRCDALYVNGKSAVETHQADAECSYESRSGTVTCSTYIEELATRRYRTAHVADRPKRDQVRVERADEAYLRLMGDGDFPSGRLPRCAPGSKGEGGRSIASQGKLEKSGNGTSGCATFEHFVVPDDHAFVMSDNRDFADDSRRWGPVPQGNVLGVVKSVVAPGGQKKVAIDHWE